MGLTRSRLETLENENRLYFGTLGHLNEPNGIGVYWIDWENNAYYAWETGNERLTSKDLSNSQIESMVAYKINKRSPYEQAG